MKRSSRTGYVFQVGDCAVRQHAIFLSSRSCLGHDRASNQDGCSNTCANCRLASSMCVVLSSPEAETQMVAATASYTDRDCRYRSVVRSDANPQWCPLAPFASCIVPPHVVDEFNESTVPSKLGGQAFGQAAKATSLFNKLKSSDAAWRCAKILDGMVRGKQASVCSCFAD